MNTRMASNKVSMMNKIADWGEDNEDDLEALRLAALQSIKTGSAIKSNIVKERGKGKVFRNRYKMNTRSNLITIVPISETTPIETTSNNISIMKDRKYANVNHQYIEKYVPSKFNRYEDFDTDSSVNNSDDECHSIKNPRSCSEDIEVKEDCSPVSTYEAKEDSLETLMDQLEQEINGIIPESKNALHINSNESRVDPIRKRKLNSSLLIETHTTTFDNSSDCKLMETNLSAPTKHKLDEDNHVPYKPCKRLKSASPPHNDQTSSSIRSKSGSPSSDYSTNSMLHKSTRNSISPQRRHIKSPISHTNLHNSINSLSRYSKSPCKRTSRSPIRYKTVLCPSRKRSLSPSNHSYSRNRTHSPLERRLSPRHNSTLSRSPSPRNMHIQISPARKQSLSPRRHSGSPNRWSDYSRRRSPSLWSRSVSPTRKVFSSRQNSFSSRRSNSIRRSRSPRQRLSPPRRRTGSPSRISNLLHTTLSLPEWRSISPRRLSISSRKCSGSPESFSAPLRRQRSVSSKRFSLSPARRSLSPRSRSGSPRSTVVAHKSVPLNRRPDIPRQISISPRNKSLSPRKRLHSPRLRSPLHKRPFSLRLRSPSFGNRSLSPSSRPMSPRKRSRTPRNLSTSPLSRSSSPRTRSVSVRNKPISPRERPLSPRNRLISVRNRSISPRDRFFSLRNVSVSPRRRSISPRNRPLSPRKRSISPRKRSISPRKRSISPRKRSISPRKRSVSPRKRSVSPRKRSVSPRKRSVSPRKRSLSPRKRSVSPRKRSLSPRKRSVSPRKRAVSPRKRTVSPRSRSVSPRSRSVSPRNRPVSPRNRPVSPRKRSISPRRIGSLSLGRAVSPRRKRTDSPRRKKGSISPRRKRSVSPRRKRSVSPRRKRSVSPRRKRSVSPRRKRSVSPRVKGSLSPPRKRSASPRNRNTSLQEPSVNLQNRNQSTWRETISKRKGSISPPCKISAPIRGRYTSSWRRPSPQDTSMMKHASQDKLESEFCCKENTVSEWKSRVSGDREEISSLPQDCDGRHNVSTKCVSSDSKVSSNLSELRFGCGSLSPHNKNQVLPKDKLSNESPKIILHSSVRKNVSPARIFSQSNTERPIGKISPQKSLSPPSSATLSARIKSPISMLSGRSTFRLESKAKLNKSHTKVTSSDTELLFKHKGKFLCKENKEDETDNSGLLSTKEASQKCNQSNWSRTPSLSPSPDKSLNNEERRYKSPLRLHPLRHSEYRNNSIKNIPHDDIKNHKRTINAGHKEDSILHIHTNKFNRKDGKKRVDTKQELLKDDEKKQKTGIFTKEHYLKKNTCQSDDYGEKKKGTYGSISTKDIGKSCESDCNKDNILEARRRKFEMSGPLEPSGKILSLKTPKLSADNREKIDEDLLDKTAVDGDDFLDLELDKSINLWSSSESDSENEARFKSHKQQSTSRRGVTNEIAKLMETSKNQPSRGENQNRSEGRSVRSSGRGKSRLHVHGKPGIQSKSKESLSHEPSKRKVNDKKKGDSAATVHSKNKVEKHKKPKSDSKRSEELSESTDASTAKDGDLRAELSRRRAERLIKAGSLDKSLPARLLQSAFQGVVGRKNTKNVEKAEKQTGSKSESEKRAKDKLDGRRVMVLKPLPMEEEDPENVLGLSVTVPKDRKRGKSPSKLPIHLRLGLPGKSWDPERKRRGYRKNGTISSFTIPYAAKFSILTPTPPRKPARPLKSTQSYVSVDILTQDKQKGLHSLESTKESQSPNYRNNCGTISEVDDFSVIVSNENLRNLFILSSTKLCASSI